MSFLCLTKQLTSSVPYHSTIACSIVRIKCNSEVELEDATWNYVANMIWSTIEGNVGVICACLPVLAPVFHVFTACFGVASSPSLEALNRGGYRKSSRSRPSELEDLSNFARLEEDTAKILPIRKTVKVETVAGNHVMDIDNVFDVRRPGDM